MLMTLFLLVVIACVAVVSAIKQHGKFQAVLAKRKATAQYLPQAIGMLVLTAQVSELVRVVEHVTIVNLAAALLLLAIIVATKTGTEGELH
jgi:hypothetical protein